MPTKNVSTNIGIVKVLRWLAKTCTMVVDELHRLSIHNASLYRKYAIGTIGRE